MLLDIFIVVNFAFLALDVLIAHAVNKFAHPAEWIPCYFSLLAAILLGVTIFGKNLRVARWCRIGVGWGAIALGVGGMLFHLDSRFFVEFTLKSLVYTAPFVAPLAFTGLGLLLLLSVNVASDSEEWGLWLVFLSGCGWLGNFVLSVLDHAQNGFFNLLEWIPVCTSALAVGCTITVILFPRANHLFFVIVLTVNAVVGILGFFLHLYANLQMPATTFVDSLIYGTPLFAPLLFPNLAILSLLGIWRVQRNLDYSADFA